jgi:hypothetical protein
MSWLGKSNREAVRDARLPKPSRFETPPAEAPHHEGIGAIEAVIFMRLLICGVLLLPSAGLAAAEPPKFTPKPVQIDRNGVMILIRSTLAALDQANKTGNYTVLRDLAAPNFAAVNNAARLAEIFASQRNSHLDLSGALVLDPQLTLLPETDEAGHMRFAGFFPSVPTQVEFRLSYEPVNGQWRLFGLSVNLMPSTPAAPVPPAASPPPVAADAPAAKETPAPKPAPVKRHLTPPAPSQISSPAPKEQLQPPQ